jgi:hypothetical protein
MYPSSTSLRPSGQSLILDLLGVEYQYNVPDKIEMERVNIPDELSQGHTTMNETYI